MRMVASKDNSRTKAKDTLTEITGHELHSLK